MAFVPERERKQPPELAREILAAGHGLGLGRLDADVVEGDAAVVVDFAPRRVRITTPFARMTKL